MGARSASPRSARRRVRDTSSSHPKMLAQLQALRLVVRADALAVHGIGPRQHFLIHQTADDLAVLEDERYFARAHFQDSAGALPAGTGIAEAGIEEAGIVHAEFADQRIERYHLGGVIRRHLNRFFRGENIKLAGIENQAAVGPPRHPLPKPTPAERPPAIAIDP